MDFEFKVMESGHEAGRRVRVLWFLTQPEHYHIRMLDDLARGTPYRVPGMEHFPPAPPLDCMAVFSWRGPGDYTENPLPSVAGHIILRARPGLEGRAPGPYERYHVDWRGELDRLAFDVAIFGGYATRTHRQAIAECRRRGIPVAMWTDSNLRNERRRVLSRKLKRHFLRPLIENCDLLLTASRLGVGYWRYYGAPSRKLAVCTYYSDYHRIDAARLLSRDDVFARHSIAPDRRLVFTSARLVPVKGLDLMIRAFVNGGFGERGWTYLIAGAGEQEAALKKLAGPALGTSIRFAGFQQPSENLALMAHADLFVLPSRFEPHGIVVGEAMAAGTPVVASDVVGAARDLVVHGRSGLIFAAGDAADLEAKLRTIEDTRVLTAMRIEARRCFEAWYLRTSPVIVLPRLVWQMIGRKSPAR